MLLALLPLITALAPLAAKALGSALGGGEGKRVAEQIEPAVTAAAVRVFGTDDPETAMRETRRNPALAQEFEKEMAAIAAQAQATAAQLQIEAMKADLANVQGARENQLKLAQAGSLSSWAPTIMSVLIVVGFFTILGVLIVKPFSITDQQREVLMLMLGALTLAFGDVRSYWLGSSAGSRAKEGALAEQAQRAVDAISKRHEDEAKVPPAAVPALPAPSPQVVVVPSATPAATPDPASAPAVMDWQQGPHGGVRFRLGADGYLMVEGEAAPGRTVGEPVTVRRIWKDYGPTIADSCARNGVPLELAVACIATESRGVPAAVLTEPDGRASVGLMQVLLSTAEEMLGVKVTAASLKDPATGIEAGVRYIAKQYPVTRFLPPFVAAAYNAGGLHPPREQDSNRWNLRSTGNHVDRYCLFFNDCVFVAKADGWSH